MEKEQHRAVVESFQQGSIIYSINLEEKTASVVASKAEKDENIIIPRSINYKSAEYVITSISKYAFKYSELKSIQFPPDSEIRIIDCEAFRSSTIESITISPHLTTIGNAAFSFCHRLKTIIIPENSELKTICEFAFHETIIESLSIPASLVYLEDGWCESTNNLNEVKVDQSNPMYRCIDDKYVIGKSSIENDDFDVLIFCSRNAEKVAIPSYIKRIGPHAFANCNRIEKVEFSKDSKLEIIDHHAFFSSSIKSVTIPLHLTKICDAAFSYCHLIESIEIPENSELKTIEKFAFFQSSIESLTIPQSLIELRSSWPSITPRLRSVNVHPNNQRYMKYDDNLIIGKSSIENDGYDVLIFCNRNAKKVTIPSFIRTIDDCAFQSCSSLRSVEIQDDSQLCEIGKESFANTAIESFTIPSHLTKIGESAFNRCIRLQKIDIQSNSVLRIDDSAFCCSSIDSLIIPPNLTEIGSDAFYECKNLQIIEISEDSKSLHIDDEAFDYGCQTLIMIPAKKRNLLSYT